MKHWPAIGMMMVGMTMAASGAAQERSQERPVILITGSTDGLGREVARRLADDGAHVIVHGRSQERGAALVREIEADGRGTASFHAADLASLAQVREFAQTILREHDRLDVLVNNAGIWLPSRPRQVSDDGHELHFAVNYLAGYLLTDMLMPLLLAAPGARIINVASGSQAPLDFDDIMLEHDYSGRRAYAQSKLAQVMFTTDLAQQLEGTGAITAALHPATLMNTSMVEAAGVAPRSTVEQGAAAVVHLVTAPGVRNGQYYNGQEPARANAQAYDDDARARLRALSDRLTQHR